MRIGVYLADQVFERTQSKGIYSYSRTLAEQLARSRPDDEIVLIVNTANRESMTPAPRPNVTTAVYPAACAGGVARIWADHVLAPYLARTLALDLIHFPKGYVPWPSCGRARVTATIHDTIPIVYGSDHPGHFRPAKLRYLKAMILHGLRTCSGIMTDSAFSRSCLLALAEDNGISPAAIDVCPLVPDPSLVEGPRVVEERSGRGLLHLGSRLPHKRTAWTIERFRAFNRRQGGGWRLRVTGLSGPIPGQQSASGEDVAFVGPLSSHELRRELEGANALLLLSSVEGFGLPALEAWFLGTPVCYSRGGALPEVLAGVPGLCAGDSQEEFNSALETVLSLDRAERAAIQARLRERFALDGFARRVNDVFTRWLEGGRARDRP